MVLLFIYLLWLIFLYSLIDLIGYLIIDNIIHTKLIFCIVFSIGAIIFICNTCFKLEKIEPKKEISYISYSLV